MVFFIYAVSNIIRIAFAVKGGTFFASIAIMLFPSILPCAIESFITEVSFVIITAVRSLL